MKNKRLPCTRAQSASERFMRSIKINRETECWEWQGTLTHGYGALMADGKMILAHRFAYEHFTGSLNGLDCLHHCDNRKCCNPAHLYPGTDVENMRDSLTRGRRLKARFYAGEIELIRSLRIVLNNNLLRKSYKFSAVYVAKMFKTKHNVILSIWNETPHICREGYYV